MIDGYWSGSGSVTRVTGRVMSLRSGSWVERGIVRGSPTTYPIIRFPMTKYERVDLHPPNRWDWAPS